MAGSGKKAAGTAAFLLLKNTTNIKKTQVQRRFQADLLYYKENYHPESIWNISKSDRNV
jgi:hypothetical protein